MNHSKGFSLLLLLCIVVLSAIPVRSSPHSPVALLNRIEGRLWNPDRQPARDLYVELQNENYVTIARSRSDFAGRFTFSGISEGTYTVKVLTTGTNYLEASERVDVVGIVRGRNDTVYVDIQLRFDSRKVETRSNEIPEVVFVQEVPAEARTLYKKGVKDLQKGDVGLNQIEEALKIFPTYFDALNTLGREYVTRKEYQKSLAYLVKSIEVNQRSYSSFYALAFACYQLNHRPEALEAARGATLLQPGSINAQLLYGTLLRIDRSFETAEKTLLEAKKLSKGNPVSEIHWQLALLYNKLGRNAEAANELETYLSIQPDARDKKEIQALITKLRKPK